MNLDQLAARATQAHADVNQTYGGHHPYGFHLAMVAGIAADFLPQTDFSPADRLAIRAACWLHDVIEDARFTYNDVARLVQDCGGTRDDSILVAELVRAVTSDIRGRTRAERQSPAYYAELRQDRRAVFVKLCDRLANVRHSQVEGQHMLTTYRDEYPKFRSKLYDSAHRLEPLWAALDGMLTVV